LGSSVTTQNILGQSWRSRTLTVAKGMWSPAKVNVLSKSKYRQVIALGELGIGVAEQEVDPSASTPTQRF
jgi:hypothetical protein